MHLKRISLSTRFKGVTVELSMVVATPTELDSDQRAVFFALLQEAALRASEVYAHNLEMQKRD